MGANESPVHVGVDIGGTFTDIIAFEPATDDVHISKVLSTPNAPSVGVVDGLEDLFSHTAIEPGDIDVLSHGSTVTINALIERTGAHTGVLVTEGFEAIPLAGHGEKPNEAIKNPRYQAPDQLVPLREVKGVPERMGADGTAQTPLDEEAARERIVELRDAGVDSIAVCLLFSFLNDAHERRLEELIGEIHPDCAVSLSSQIAPRIKEFPRLSTTSINAYVDPILSAYLADLQAELDDLGVRPETLTMMLSHGGLTGFEAAAESAVGSILSGPAAGVQGALFAARQTGIQDVITMDMGGTSCDIAIAPDREPVMTTEKEIDQNPVAVRLIDVQAIGAGGGTIASVEGERLRVGPASAGAEPGPVCYARGGEATTITDANVVLDRLSPETELAGGIELDREAAVAALEAQIADPLGLSTSEAAAGVIEVVNDKMKKELSLALSQHGYDPREFSLVVYGGAGPMHAPPIARDLNLQQVLVPPRPGINSAVGLLTTDRQRLFERSEVEPLESAAIEATFEELRQRARSACGLDEDQMAAVDVHRELDLRYHGQLYHLSVDAPTSEVAAIESAFNETHRRRFGHVSDQPIETMTYRITVTIPREKLTDRSFERSAATGPAEPERERPVYFGETRRDTPIYRRGALRPGSELSGPAVVEQADTTVVIEPGMDATVDDYGNILVDPGRGAR